MKDNVCAPVGQVEQPFDPFERLWTLGYKTLVPIIPPGAPISVQSSLYKRVGTHQDGRGKVPGVKGSDGNWFSFNWLPHETDEDDLRRWAAMGAGVGVRTGPLGDGTTLVGGDADAPEEAHALIIRDVFRKHLGSMMPIRVGRLPKALYLFRVRGDYTYTRLDFGPRDDKGNILYRVEMLSQGQQFVAHGVHPKTMQPYSWPKPLVAINDLPIFEPEQIDAALQEMASLLPQAATKLSKAGGDGDVNQAALRGDLEKVQRAVRATRNTTAAFPTREAYRDYGYAIKAALPDHPDEAFGLYADWCDRWQDEHGRTNGPDIYESDWRRMKPPFRIGASYLYEKAEQFSGGSFTRGEVWFNTVPEADRAETIFDMAAQGDNTGNTDVILSLKAVPDFPHDPVDLWGRFEPPALPRGLLPQVIEDFARIQGKQMGADPAGIAVAALVTSAAAITDAIRLKVKRHDRWSESARLWAALVGTPSTKKSPILKVATEPLCEIDNNLFRKWQAQKTLWDGLEKKERKGHDEPKQRRLRLADTTPEAAQMVLENSPDGVLLLQDELSGFFGAMDKYNGGKGASADRAFWLQSFNGDQYALNRAGRGAALIPNLSVCLLGGIQPEPIRKVAGDTNDDGLLQRLFPIVLRPATMGRDEPAADVVGEYGALIRRLNQLVPSTAPLMFDDGAMKIREDLERKHLELQTTELVNRKLASHVGKYDGLFARLCVVWHCIEHAHAPELPGVVSQATTERVAAFLHGFLLRHAFAFYSGVLGLSDDHDDLSAIAGYILSKRLEKVAHRDVQQGTRSMKKLTERDTRPLFEQLAAMGWMERIDGPRPSSAPHWLVNPLVHVRFADHAAAERDRRARAREVLTSLGRADQAEMDERDVLEEADIFG